MVATISIVSWSVDRRYSSTQAGGPSSRAESVLMMYRYMLDTDTVSFALRGEGRVAIHVLEQRPSKLCVSSITLAELRFGAQKRRSSKLHALIDAFVGDVAVLPFDQNAADCFAEIAASLAGRGAPIGTFDALLAAHALSLRLTFVTNNVRHFERVAALKTENWV